MVPHAWEVTVQKPRWAPSKVSTGSTFTSGQDQKSGLLLLRFWMDFDDHCEENVRFPFMKPCWTASSLILTWTHVQASLSCKNSNYISSAFNLHYKSYLNVNLFRGLNIFWVTLGPLLTLMFSRVVRFSAGGDCIDKVWIIPTLVGCLLTRDYCKYLRGTVDMKITLTNGFTSMHSWKGPEGMWEWWREGREGEILELTGAEKRERTETYEDRMKWDKRRRENWEWGGSWLKTGVKDLTWKLQVQDSKTIYWRG